MIVALPGLFSYLFFSIDQWFKKIESQQYDEKLVRVTESQKKKKIQ